MAQYQQFDLIVAGGGAAGLAAALTLGRQGWSVAVLDPGSLGVDATADDDRDARTTAIMAGGIRMLDRLGVWSHLTADSAALRYLELVDDSSTPPLSRRFDAGEIGQDWFAQNVPNRQLKNALLDALGDQLEVELLPGEAVANIVQHDRAIHVRGTSGTVYAASLLIAADGQRSACRTLAHIPVSRRPATETALVFNVGHELDHQGISYEFHGLIGQVTTIPLPGRRSAINIVSSNARAEQRLALPPTALTALVAQATRDRLGAITDLGKVQPWPVRPFRARRLVAGRMVLVGEAAHALPPIGAQGLNTSLADIALLAELIGERLDNDDLSARNDPAAAELLRRYESARLADIRLRAGATGLLSGLVHRRNGLIDRLRRLGLKSIADAGPVRRALMAQGMAPFGPVPALMR